MRLLLAASICALAAPVRADDLPVVVELYTSQGCSSCPAADAMLADLADRDDVIPLALHVDYWDYIGWADSFAHAGFTERQQAYARRAGERMIYTPQMIFGGQDAAIGGDSLAVMERLRAHAGATSPVRLTVEREGGTLSIGATSETPLPPLTVQVVRYMPRATVAIEAGENAGQTFDYVNIVTDWQVVGEWTGDEPLAIEVPGEGDAPVVVILQEHGPGAIRAASRLE